MARVSAQLLEWSGHRPALSFAGGMRTKKADNKLWPANHHPQGHANFPKNNCQNLKHGYSPFTKHHSLMHRMPYGTIKFDLGLLALKAVPRRGLQIC